jgi:hypothetical protein
MIENDEQLEVVRSQLAHAERALSALRRDVLPKNASMYGVMSESYIELIHALRQDIDEYLGIALGNDSSDSNSVELQGVIRSVDLDAQTFVLRERPEDQPDIACEYGRDLDEVVRGYLGSSVIVIGTVESSRKTRKSSVSVDSIRPNRNADESTAKIAG